MDSNSVSRRHPEGHCGICGRKLNNPNDPVRSKDCGGDCQECMASFYDPDAMAALHAIDPERYPLDD